LKESPKNVNKLLTPYQGKPSIMKNNETNPTQKLAKIKKNIQRQLNVLRQKNMSTD